MRGRIGHWLTVWGMSAAVAVSPAVAGRPLAVDDADPAGRGECEIEAGALYERAGAERHWEYPFGVACGLGYGVELGLGFGGQLDERCEQSGEARGVRRHTEDGVGDLVLGLKWQFAEGRGAWPRQALAPSVKFPTADADRGMGSGETDVDLAWLVSFAPGRTWGVHVNLGYTLVGDPDGLEADDVVHGGLALDWQALESVQLVGEVAAEREVRGAADTPVLVNAGLRWMPVDGWVLDAAAGARLGQVGPDYTVTVGLTRALALGGE